MDILHKEKTYILRKCIFDVHNSLGVGWPEEIYHQALYHKLIENNVPTLFKPRKPLIYNGQEIHTFEPDLIVWNTIVLELKALPYTKQFLGEHIGQIIHYLKMWEMDLGLLINFSLPKANIKRIVWHTKSVEIAEDYDQIKSKLSDEDRINLRQLRQFLINFSHKFGLGFSEKVYRLLLAMEAESNRISCKYPITIQPNYDSVLPEKELDHLFFFNKYLVKVRSIIQEPSIYDIKSTKNFIKTLNIKFGLIIVFSQKNVQILGIITE